MFDEGLKVNQPIDISSHVYSRMYPAHITRASVRCKEKRILHWYLVSQQVVMVHPEEQERQGDRGFKA